ncbi:hypothetical protein BKP56_09190 [Marinilactibacillus sp. 15R]|uniref:helix-turn-helix domain-containing protein n=1 Tax=Marinilactibacillus sp. 15R TaxID=1911586 RepID=UPI0009096970|nr:helix-turn-helix transcriptional regulator [Marinilactibacillus sp. 15R]API89418.1 hypothetical protein BKP56_09190 [Marinilactibacillus sp. 15R]
MNSLNKVENKMKQTVARNFKQKRKKAGLSIYRLADTTGISSVTIQKLENEGHFSPKTLAGVCYMLDIEPATLFLEEVDA